MGETSRTRQRRPARWTAGLVRQLRHHLGATQQELAAELGVRQQTVSEWETGVYAPRGSSATLLSIIAEDAAFPYQSEGSGGSSTEDAADGRGT